MCVWFVCVQILAPPLVQCTYIGPTVPIHNFLLCFKCIYFLKRPPPLLLPPVCKGRTHPSGTPTADALRLLRKGVLSSIWLLFRRGRRRIIQRQEQTDILCSNTRGIFDEVTWGLLKYCLVNQQDLLTLISTSALKCILWSLMNSISV